jgi:mRNA interferase MazF
MPINFSPDPGQILMCDFTTGFMRPEMQKIRHCVAVSPKAHTGSCLIVPLSTLQPVPIKDCHYLIPRHVYPCIECGADVWAKADMLTHAAFARLDRPKENGLFSSRFLMAKDLQSILKCLFWAINCGRLVNHL